jgi:hypothetical protein
MATKGQTDVDLQRRLTSEQYNVTQRSAIKAPEMRRLVADYRG